IGKMYGDIPLSSIRSWNNLKGNNIGIGEYLIIGWLRNNPDNSHHHSQDISSSPVPDTTPAETDSADKNIPSSQNDEFLKEVISSEKRRVKHKGKNSGKTEPVSRPLLARKTTSANSSTKKERQNPPNETPPPLLSGRDEDNIP